MTPEPRAIRSARDLVVALEKESVELLYRSLPGALSRMVESLVEVLSGAVVA